MKPKLAPVFLIAVMSIFLFACSPASQEVSVEASCEDFAGVKNITRNVQVAVGDLFTVTLCSNPTTGFKWSESAQISDQTVLQQTDHKFIAPEAKPPLVGAPGKEIWTFKALKKGTSSIFMEYSQPWQGGGKGAWTFNLTVGVK